MSASKVYVVQRPAFYCRERRGWVNKYDLSPALEFGELIYLLKPGNIYRDQLHNSLITLQDGLKTYTENDYILAVGDPVAISAAVIVAYENANNSVQLLKYDRISNKYGAFKISF